MDGGSGVSSAKTPSSGEAGTPHGPALIQARTEGAGEVAKVCRGPEGIRAHPNNPETQLGENELPKVKMEGTYSLSSSHGTSSSMGTPAASLLSGHSSKPAFPREHRVDRDLLWGLQGGQSTRQCETRSHLRRNTDD